jgi:membrane-associated phospholipid phosphatase
MDFVHWLQSSANPTLDSFWGFFSDLNAGDIGLLIVAVYFWCVDTRVGWLFGNVVALGVFSNEAIKSVVQEARPSPSEVRVIREDTAPGSSFPSGHTQFATIFWGYLGWLLKRPAVWVLCAAMIVLTGLSRLYMGLHWPWDVLGAIAIGAAFLVGAIWISQRWLYSGGTFNQAARVALVVIPVIAFGLVPNKTIATAAGVALGMNIAYLWILPRHIGQFPVRAGTNMQIVKVVIGIAGVMILRIALKALFPDVPAADFVRYSIIGLWVGWLAPFVFTRLVRIAPTPALEQA